MYQTAKRFYFKNKNIYLKPLLNKRPITFVIGLIMKKISTLSALFFTVAQAAVATDYVVTDQIAFDAALLNSAGSAENNTITVNAPGGIAINSATLISGNSPNDLAITFNGVTGSPEIPFDINAPLTVNSDGTLILESTDSSKVKMNVVNSVTQSGGQITSTNGSVIAIQDGGNYTFSGGKLQLGGENALITVGTGTFNLDATTAKIIQVVDLDPTLNVSMHMDQPSPPTSNGMVILDTNSLNATILGQWITANNTRGFPSFNKIGTGNLTLNDFRVTGGGEYHLIQGTADIQGNVTIPYLAVGTGNGADVIMTISDSNANLIITQPDANNQASALQVGDFGGTAVVNQSAGTVYAHESSFNISNQGGQGTYNINGGTINFASLTPTTYFFNVGRNDGNNPATTGTLNIRGGAVNVYSSATGGNARLILGSRSVATGASSNGILNQTGGILSIQNGGSFYLSSNGNGEYNLTGGVLEIGGLSFQENYLAGPGTYQFNFGGNGEIHVINSDLISSVDISLLPEGQGIIDTKGFNATFSGNMIGSGALVKKGLGTLFLTGINSYNGGTTVSQGILEGNTNGIQGDIINNATVSFDQVIDGVYSGNMSGTGELIKNNAGKLTLIGTNSYSNGTTILNGVLQGNTNSLQGNIHNDAIVIFDQASDGVYSGNMSGLGSLTKIGTGKLILTGVNSYNNGTSILSGTLQGDTNSLQKSIDIGSNTLIFNQRSPGIFNGTLTSGVSTRQEDGATFNKIGPSSLTLTTNNSSFTGTTNILEGSLILRNTLGGNINVTDTGILTGTGTVLGNLNVDNGGGVSVGPERLNIAGNYSQGTHGRFLATLDMAKIPYLNVGLTADIDGTLQIKNGNGFKVNSTYNLLHADDGLTGKFTILIANPLLLPVLTYAHTDVFLDVEIDYTRIAKTQNQRSVATQLNTLTDPTPEQELILNEILALAENPLTIQATRDALDELSGQQYTNRIVQAELNSSTFTHQIYDGLRSAVTTSPCSCAYPLDICEICTWIELGGGTAQFKGGKEVKGFNLNQFALAAGIHRRWTDCLIAGIAGSYENEKVNYKLAGHSHNQIFSGAVYGLYRPENYYVWADMAINCDWYNVDRLINVGSLRFSSRSKPKTYQGSAYVEAGFDIFKCNVLIQPFVGIQAGYAKYNSIREHGSDFDLRIGSKTQSIANSSLGIHATSDDLFAGINLSLDLSWQCRLAPLHPFLNAQFISFGDSFEIVGAPFARNSVYWGLTTSKRWTYIEGYVQANGQQWSHASAYNFIGGINYCW